METYTLASDSTVFPMWFVVTCKTMPYGQEEWCPTSIEIYAEPECVTLLADDIWGELPKTTQDSIIRALSKQERDEITTVLRDIMTTSRYFS